MNLTHTISRWECRECGSTSFEARQGRAHLRPEPGILNECPCRAPVDRVYVAVDALLSDEAVWAARDAVIGVDEWLEQGRAAICAAVDAVTGKEGGS